MIHSFPTRRSSDLLYSSVDDPDVLSAPRIPCDGQSRMMASRTVTSWASLNTQDSVPPLTSKPSKTTWLDCWNLMVCVPPRRTGRVEPTERFQRNVTGLRSEEHTSELQSLMRTSYAVFCLKKKNQEVAHT